MRESVFETLIGALVLVAAAVFMWFALDRGGDAAASGASYNVSAKFNNVSGINRGSDVRLAGLKIGVVEDMELNPQTYEADIRLSIDGTIDLPDDSDARISTDGLLGGAYIALEPGGGFDFIAKDGSGEILYTRGSVDLLTLVGSFASSLGGDGETDDGIEP
ncbi:MAG: outer membrane lipid asymmetry maintenance protein MlaD [Pseudomonadota bacterium]